MRPHESIIEGLGAFKERFVFNWKERSGTVAIVAPSGTGKSIFLGIPMGVLYKTFVYYPDLYNLLTIGGNGKGYISYTFEDKGIIYRAERYINGRAKTKTQTATLTIVATGEVIAGPKEKDFRRKVDALFGTVRTIMATSFLAQTKFGDLIGTPGESDLGALRRGVFKDLLRAESFDVIAKGSGKIRSGLEGTAKEKAAQLAADPDFESLLAQAIRDGDTASRKAKGHEADVKRGIERLEAALQAKAGIVRDDGSLQRDIDNSEAADDRVISIFNDLNDKRDELHRLEKIVEGIEKHGQDVKKRTLLQVKESALTTEQALYERSKEFAGALSKAKGLASALETREEPSIDTNALSKELEDVANEYKAAKAKNGLAEKTNVTLRNDRWRAQSHIDKRNVRIESSQDRLDANPGVLFGDKCKECPQVADLASLPDEIAGWKSEIETLEESLRVIPEEEKIQDLEPIIARGEECRAARKEVEQYEADAPKRERHAAAVVDMETAKNAQSEFLQGIDGFKSLIDHTEQIEDTRKDIEDLSGAAAKLTVSEETEKEIPSAQSDLGTARDNLDTAKADAEKAKGFADVARKALENRGQAEKDADEWIEKCTEAKANAEKQLETCRINAAGFTSDIERYEESSEASTKKRTDIAELERDISAFKDLGECFGANGVLKLLIDDAAPAIQEHANTLMDIATEGRWSVRIATLRLKSDGSSMEAFDIMITDDCGERDALEYSGGEAQLIRIIFRIAVAMWNGNVHGQQPECLALDEAPDQIGEDGKNGTKVCKDDLMRVLTHMESQFDLIQIVTHDPGIGAKTRSSILLEV